jgi:hypothetical protein
VEEAVTPHPTTIPASLFGDAGALTLPLLTEETKP